MSSSPMIARRVRRALAAAESSSPSSELNIVPFLDIVTNLLLFLLATTSVVLVVAEVDARLPARGSGHGADVRTVSVTITERGMVIAGPGGFATPGCEATARESAVAVPARDYAALSACMARVHARVDDDRVIVSADPQVPYEDVLRAIDAVRAHGDRALFSDVLISAGVR